MEALDGRVAPQIETLVQAVTAEGIDVVIHNAGVAGHGLAPEEVRRRIMAAPLRVAQALRPAVIRSREKTIVLLTSQLGARYGSTRRVGISGDLKAALHDAFRAHVPCVGSCRSPCHRRASRMRTHRQGWRRSACVGDGERPRHAVEYCPFHTSEAWPILDLGGTRTSVVTTPPTGGESIPPRSSRDSAPSLVVWTWVKVRTPGESMRSSLTTLATYACWSNERAGD
jgi:hypothetical protein